MLTYAEISDGLQNHDDAFAEGKAEIRLVCSVPKKKSSNDFISLMLVFDGTDLSVFHEEEEKAAIESYMASR